MAETIKEFLVSLGFRTDAAGLNKFKSDIQNATKAVLKIGAALVAVKAITTGFVASVASNFNRLHDLSKQINVPIKTIQEFGYIASLTGSSVDAANSSLHNLSRILGEASVGLGRGAATFKALGLSAKKQNGDLKTTEEILGEIGKRIKNVSASEKNAILSRLGIDSSLAASLTHDVSEIRNEFNRLYSDVGLNSEAAGKSSAEFIDSIHKLSFVFNTLKQSIALQFIPELKEGIETLRKLMIENSKKIIQTITPILKILLTLTEAFFTLAKRVIEWSKNLIDIFQKINEATSGWAGYILAAVAAWKILNAVFLASPVGRLILLGLVLALLIDDFQGYNEGLKSAINWGWGFNKVLLALGISIVAFRVGILAAAAAVATFKSAIVLGTRAMAAFRIVMLLANPIGLWVAAVAALSTAAYFLIKNWQKVKDWFAPFFTWMTAGFQKLGDVISRVVDNVKIKFDVDDTGAAKISRDAFAGSTRRLTSFGSTPLLQGGSSSSVNQSVNQDVKITVNGSNSPQETAKAIYKEQSRLNADLTRNFAGAVR
jgi:putative Mn2+ efflux pump MntP